MGGDLPDEYRTNPVASSVLQHQHEHLAEQVRCLKEENARLTEAFGTLVANNALLERRISMFNRGGGFTLAKLCEALGWQNATIHQVLAEVKRLVALQSAMSMIEQENAELRSRFRGCCPDAQDFDTEEAYKEALAAWEKS